ncbi:hypothetical protein [Streptosporangium roseum]|uniref:hypothetical protein n=1 Tax=Streptosporangium roseum TaxID=2001 RepID=UPI00332809A9
MSNRVTITLANPLRTQDADELGLESRTYRTGETIELPRSYAERLAGAGYVKGAEPQKLASVHAAMTPAAPPAPAPAPAPVTPVVSAAAPAKKPAKVEQE